MAPEDVAFLALTSCVSVVAIVTNTITLAVLASKKDRDATTAIFMMNVSICDLFITAVSNPLYAINIAVGEFKWNFDTIACKLFKFATTTAVTSQTYFMVLISYDLARRLDARHFKRWTHRKNVLVVAAIWMFSFVFCSPILGQFSLEHLIGNGTHGQYLCKPWSFAEDVNIAYTSARFGIAYALPLAVSMYSGCKVMAVVKFRRRVIPANTQQKTRTLTIVVVCLSLTFLAIWTPFFLLSLLDFRFGSELMGMKDMNFTLRCSLVLFGSLKPVIYFVCLREFRADANRVCHKWTPCLVRTVQSDRRISPLSIEVLPRDACTKNYDMRLHQDMVLCHVAEA